MADQTGPKRTKIQREYDLQEIANLYLKGWIQAAISKHIADNRPYRVSQQQISNDIKAIQKRWLESSLVDYDASKAEALAKIDNLEQTYWLQYEASKQPMAKRKVSKKVDGETVEVSQELASGAGDPRYLQGVQWCIDRRIKLMGLDSPIKSEVTGKGGGPIETKTLTPDFSTLTDEELELYVSLAKKLSTNGKPNP